MPVYAYGCKDCGHAFDIRQSFSEDALTVCPECGGDLRKKFNTVGVVFKGSGFYRTDSRAGASSADTASPAPASSGSSPSSGPAPAAASAGSSAGAGTGGSAA
ncbi:FmdB family zinc ribbon protein [Kocuria rosea]|uniref:FmdB family zinc ribbon protein n=1 Tax=Kocuria rosea TaxID=1275 RepID=UPI00203D99FF|nr:FmdB family zinc ribbon protein [Kocuria rosea]MCM3689289.1 FmdB family transcriptional regulator [Kocuria rosea]